MYILTNHKNVILDISKILIEKEDRYATDNFEIMKEYKTQNIDGTITVDAINAFEVQEISENIEIEKYCYTENDGFYKNPDYKEEYTTEQRLEALEQMMNELILGEE